MNSAASIGPISASVTVPATSANLGCAFDCAAIALALHLRVSATVRDSGFEVVYRGPDPDFVTNDQNNLIVRAMLRCAGHFGAKLSGARLDVDNEVPLGVGLGSSAAAIVAGIALGASLCGVKLDAAVALQLAAQIEGHPDNVAAAVYGGMVVAMTSEESASVLVAKTEISQALDFVVVTPEIPLPTEKARSVLPAQYSRSDVVANLQRTALLTAALFSGKNVSPELFRDRLHQPYRSPLIPGIAQCLAYRHGGLDGVFLSGAGSSVMAIARHSATQIGEGLVEEFRRQGVGAQARVLKADNRGAEVSDSAGTLTLGAETKKSSA
jgi:homoserine kinase